MPTGLIRRGARYSIRRRVPLDLIPHYGGKAEITKSLGTADPATARKLLPLAWAALDKAFDAARAQMASSPLTPAAPLAKQPAPSGDISEARWLYENEAMEWDKHDLQREEFEREGREELERKILADLSGPAEGLTPEQRVIRDLLRDRDFEATIARDRAIIAKSRVAEAEAAAAPRPTKAGEGPVVTAGTSFDALVDKWAAERKPSAKGVDDHRALTRWFSERTGVDVVEAITKRDVLAFKDKLLSEGASLGNVKVKLSRLRTLLNFATANDLLTVNPAAGINVVDTDAERNRRKPFDRASLTAIFSSPVYAKNERPTQGRGEAAYWLPLLALYTGARLEELGQLRPDDIREEAYPDADDHERTAWVIRITEDEDDGLKLKNAASERTVPVHTDLEGLGFIRFAQAAKAADQARLFPELKPNIYGRLTAKWGEWFSRYKREVCGITDSRLVFHSFRHTFKHYARHVRMIEGVQRQIMGHSSQDVADDYGDGYSLHQLVEGMRAYRIPGFKLPPPPPQPGETTTA